jgi:hypothetical protein
MLGLTKYTSKHLQPLREGGGGGGGVVSKRNHLQPYKFKILRTLLVGNAPSQKHKKKQRRTNLLLDEKQKPLSSSNLITSRTGLRHLLLAVIPKSSRDHSIR